jgi:hypothetical protein
MMINGTNICIQQKGVTRKGKLFGSHKYAGKSALHYMLGVGILMGNLVRVVTQAAYKCTVQLYFLACPTKVRH